MCVNVITKTAKIQEQEGPESAPIPSCFLN